MNHWKQIVPIGLCILLGLSVLVTESGIVFKFNFPVYSAISLINFILFVISCKLSWAWFKKTNRYFFKWLALGIFLTVCLSIESFIYDKLIVPYFMPDQPDVLAMASPFRGILRQVLDFAAAILYIYAIFNYQSKSRFFAVFKPIWFGVIVTACLLGSVVPAVLAGLLNHQTNLLYGLFYLAELAKTAIYVYGIKASLVHYRLSNRPIFKWFTVIFAFEIAPIALAVFSYVFLLFPSVLETNFSFYYNHVISIFTLGMPVMLVIALTQYKPAETLNL